jgi:very-short-patch-repair endonuclease
MGLSPSVSNAIKAERTRLKQAYDGTPITKELVESAYWGPNPKDPASWRSLSAAARHIGASPSLIRELAAAFGIHLRTPRENFRKITWHGQQSKNPEHYSNLESLARGVLTDMGFTVGSDVLHNHKIGKCWADFYFPVHRVVLEIDSLWHGKWWRKYDRGDRDKTRDARLQALGLKVLRVNLSGATKAESCSLLLSALATAGVTPQTPHTEGIAVI